MGTIIRRVMRPFDERLDLTDYLHRNLLDRPVPVHARRFWYCFGGLTLFVIVLEALTGLALTLYYVPTPDRAYASVFYIAHYVRYGWLLRSIHLWGAHLMVIFVVIHMLRVFWTASYKHPREFNWVVGVVLLLTTIAFSITGYLLPWDQRAYTGSTVFASLIGQLPLVGEPLAQLVFGGDSIGTATITRFYSAHIMLLPGILLVFLAAHFWMLRRQGISGPPL